MILISFVLAADFYAGASSLFSRHRSSIVLRLRRFPSVKVSRVASATPLSVGRSDLDRPHKEKDEIFFLSDHHNEEIGIIILSEPWSSIQNGRSSMTRTNIIDVSSFFILRFVASILQVSASYNTLKSVPSL
jgi:hypothetical protein